MRPDLANVALVAATKGSLRCRLPMRVLVLTPYLYGTTGGPRSSIELWERVLEPAGITLHTSAFETQRLHDVIYKPGETRAKVVETLLAYRGRVGLLLRSLRDFDAVLVYREAALIGPAFLEHWVHRGGKPIIYQLDDPLYVPYRSPFNGYLSYLHFFGKVAHICRMASVVVVNSPQHREFASKHNGNVWEIPSLVDGDSYRPRDNRPRSGPVIVGWSGSSSTTSNLELVREPLERLSRRDDVELVTIGADADGLPGVRHRAQPWRAETEVADLQEFDVGLVPVPTTPWTTRKLFMKLVQYMTLGIAPVATPIGATPFMLEEGQTGFLADSPAEWTEVIERLVDDPALRTEVGRRAAEAAHARFTLQANADKIVAAVQSALDR
jgi:glycosyltransferase involved in cell wall biosynthesis